MRAGLFDDRSITRRVSRENILMLGGGRALLMQLAHPKVAAGVDEHSDFRTQPIRRLRRTIHVTMAIIFGDRETALAAARSVNQVHAKVRGTHYRALDPDLLLWVHATLTDSALVTYETFVRRLAAQEGGDFHEGSKRVEGMQWGPGNAAPASVSANVSTDSPPAAQTGQAGLPAGVSVSVPSNTSVQATVNNAG